MINYRLLFITALSVIALAFLGLLRLTIDTNVVRSLPTGEKIIADGLKIFEHHPIHDQIAVDVTLDTEAPDTLVEIGTLLEKKMMDSGLFARVGTDSASGLIPELAFHTARNLPLLFSQDELEKQVAPLLKPWLIDERVRELYASLSSMEGIGQAEFIGLDPLGLKDLVLAKLAPLAPSANTTFHRGSLLSRDNRHLLVVARPHSSGTDTASAREIAAFLNESFREIRDTYQSTGVHPTFTPVGAYRAALDNERIIRHDVQLALLLATAGIGLLLLISFPRPLIGLLSLVPALAGIGAAIFIYSLVHSSISIMVLGFGGAVISITVDHGIAYFLFLDRSHETRGKEASVEVRAIGVMAAITTIGAFLILSFSGFPVFEQLGQFTALGIFFSFVFVHSIFPRIFPTMPAGSDRALPLRSIVNFLYNTGKPGCVAALFVVLTLVWFAKPEFHTSLSSMNTVSEATVAADELFTDVWGDGGKRIYMMNTADSISHIQADNDQLLAKIESDVEGDVLADGFVPSMLFPGKNRAAQNLAAWHAFWDDSRVATLTNDLIRAGTSLGFTPEAFSDFFTLLDPAYSQKPKPIPAKFHTLLGISSKDDDGGFRQFITVMPGNNYTVDAFSNRYSGSTAIFDAVAFTDRLAEILVSTFTTMLVIISVSAALLLFFFYLSLPLTILTLLPPLFAYICTLGTLKLIGHPLDIPALMLSIVVFGMGIDYSIFCVRAHQRYRHLDHPFYTLVRIAVFMAGVSTLIGFGVLCFAEHSLLHSIGVTSILGIGYSLLGTFLLLPPLLNLYFKKTSVLVPSIAYSPAQRARAHYHRLEAYPRMFALLKLRFDPLFGDLAEMMRRRKSVNTILDIGCGYGVPACWCLEQFENAKVFGIDPDPERIRVASIATGERGTMTVGRAPALPAIPHDVDVVLLLDMLHYLDDATTSTLLQRAFTVLGNDGTLITRFVITPPGRPSWSWRLEDSRIRLAGKRPYYRSPVNLAQQLEQAGFAIEINEASSTNPELFWIVARAHTEAGDGK
ncbi:MAG: methyltransferase domain-containing protein [Desulfopila sp.]